MKTLKTVLWTLFAVLVIALLYLNLRFMSVIIINQQIIRANQAVIYQELIKPKNQYFKQMEYHHEAEER